MTPRECQKRAWHKVVIARDSRVQSVHPSLDLRASSTELKPRCAGADRVLQLGHVANTDVLERVLETGVEVREESVNGALVLNIAGHALRDLDGGGLGEITARRCVFMRRRLRRSL